MEIWLHWEAPWPHSSRNWELSFFLSSLKLNRFVRSRVMINSVTSRVDVCLNLLNSNYFLFVLSTGRFGRKSYSKSDLVSLFILLAMIGSVINSITSNYSRNSKSIRSNCTICVFQEEVKKLNKEIASLQSQIRDSLERRSKLEVS